MVFGINATLTFVKRIGTDILVGVAEEVISHFKPNITPFIPASDPRPLGASDLGKDAT